MEKKSYYKPSEIFYNIHQLTTFLLPNFSLLLSGSWVVEPTGYTDAEYRSPNMSPTANCAIEVGSEIEARLDMTDMPGLLLALYEDHDIGNIKDWYEVQKVYSEVSEQYHMDTDRVIRKSQSLLRYISGSRRPEVNYVTWLRNGHNKYPVMNLIDTILEYALGGI